MGSERARFAAGLAVLAVVHVLTRSWNLTLLPGFMDESMHVCWAARFARDPEFVKPLQDGKLLHVLLTALVVPRATDPLWAARFVSVLAGTAGLAATALLARRLYDDGVALTAAALWLVCPFTLFYDRMDLADVYLATFATVAAGLSVSLALRPTNRLAVALGVALAAAIVAKIPGVLVLPLPALACLFLQQRPRRLPKLALAYAVCALLAAAPVGYFAAHTSQVQAKAALAGDRIALLAENAGIVGRWLWSYWTPPLLLAGLATAAIDGALRRRPALFLAVACATPIAAFAAVAYDWFPRYVLFATPPLLVLAARGIVALARGLAARASRGVAVPVAIAAVAAAVFPAVRFDRALLTAPAAAPLVPVEVFQYVNGWPSGYGWDEALAALRAERKRHPEGIAIAADTAGRGAGRWTMRAGFVNDPGVRLEVVDFDDADTPALLDELVAARPTFAVRSIAAPMLETPSVRAETMAVLHKPNGSPSGTLYRLLRR